MAGNPFANSEYNLGNDRAGRQIGLGPVPRASAHELGEAFAAIDPWLSYEFSANTLSAFLSNERDGRHRFLISEGEETAGIVIVTVPWLFGPYLHFLGLLPKYQDKGIGTEVMTWFEAEAQGHFRNLWICVSDFNKGAVRFYERFGYLHAARLDGLVVDGRNEILLRKRIGPKES